MLRLQRRRVRIVAACLVLASALAAPVLAQQDESQKVVDLLGPTGRQALDTMMAQPRGYVGIQMLNLTPGLRSFFEVPKGVGVLVAETAVGGPAAFAGLQAGDVIVAIDGKMARSTQQVSAVISSRRDGPVSVDYVRKGARRSADIEVEQRRSVVVKLSPSIIRQRAERSRWYV